jgi:uncharacterized membrane protein
MEQQPMEGTVLPHFDPKDVEEHKMMACLAYINILCLVPLLFMRNSRFAQEHAKQGVILLAVWFIGGFVFWFPLVGQLIFLVLVVINVMALVKCAQGEFWEIPLIGQYRSKINL